MQVAWAIILCFLLGFLFWFIGHTITEKLKVYEQNQLLSSLLNISIGASAFLILVNLIGIIFKNFHIGLISTFAIFILLILLQIKKFIEVCTVLKGYCLEDKFSGFIKQNTDKYFWILLGIINFIYGLTAFSTIKLERFGLGNMHVFNINQLLAGNYPPKYSFLPNLDQRYHYGADILAATFSQLTGFHPEISLDILTVFFLNLSFLTFYALTIKFITSNNPFNKYLVSFAAFLAWGPITTLFNKQPGESIPQKFLEKAIYLAQNRLVPASVSGAVVHWFFAPEAGFSVFFFLIALYLIYRFFEGDNNFKFISLLSVFLSSLIIIDILKFVLVFLGVVLYLAFSSTAQSEQGKQIKQEELYKLGMVCLVVVILGFIYGNWFKLNNNFISLGEYLTFGRKSASNNISLLLSNAMLLLVYAFGFYLAYKLKHKWVSFILPFFLVSLMLPHLVSIPAGDSGKILMSCNLLGAFSLPIAFNFVQEKYNLKEIKLVAFYSLVFVVLSMSTFMFWAFGDNPKPLFKLDGTFKHTGFQVFPYLESNEENSFLKYLKSKQAKNQTIVAEPQYAEFFSNNTSIYNLYPPSNVSEIPIKKEVISQCNLNGASSFALDGKFWLTQKIDWLYITTRVFRFLMPPQARLRLLNAYLNRGAKLALSNRNQDPFLLKELYKVDSHYLSPEPSENFSTLLRRFLKSSKKKDDFPLYIKQAALCPYHGLYNAMSNDFDGDKIADIAFFDHAKKIWFIIYGKDLREYEIDLNTNILANYKGSDLFIPIPSDYDGDSKTDIALFNLSTGIWHILRSSDSKIEPARQWGGHYGESLPLPADVDGDSKADNSVYGSGNGNWPTLLTTTNSYFDHTFDPTLLDVPIYSDVDGDKKADYIIYRVNQNRFYVYLSTRAYDKNQSIQINIGGVGARIVPEDYDGDGKVDLATWVPETGKWEIAFAKDLLSMPSNSIPLHTFLLGKAGDIPMPGDYDGDGKAEIAIYHLSNSKLEIEFKGGIHKKINLEKYKKYIPANFIGV